MSLTPNLFDDDPVAVAKEVSLVRRSISFGRSKKGKIVDRLLAQVEALRTQFERERRRLEDALIFHAAHIAPRQQRVTALRADVVRQLARFLDDRRVSQRDERVLRTVLTQQIDEILAYVPTPDADIAALFHRLHGVSLAEAVQSSVDDARSEIANFFDEIGLDMEVPDLRPDMTEAEVAESAAQTVEGLRQAYEAQLERDSRRQKTKRELREQQRAAERAARREQARKISVGAIYKRLVKALHPDLEPDLSVRERKSAVMQQVTTAYAANDLPSLLRLELEWIDGAGADATRQADETLNAYAEVLREQAAELRNAIMELPFQPRYASLVEADNPYGVAFVGDGPAEVSRLDMLIENLTASIERLCDARAALHVVRGLIREYRQHERESRRHNPY